MPEEVDWFLPYIKLLISGNMWYGDYFKHVLSWLDGVRDFGKPENVLIVVYEKMKADPRRELVRVAKFLGGKAAEIIEREEVHRRNSRASTHSASWSRLARVVFANLE